MRLDEIINTHDEIKQWLDSMQIENYTINPNGIVDVDGVVELGYKGLYEIPVQFGRVVGSFWCHHNKLTSLEGAPQYVGDDFDFEENPSIINLSGIHKHTKHVGGYITIPDTVRSHILGLMLINGLQEIDVETLPDKLRSACEIINKHLKTDRDPMLAQRELMKAGLREFARY